MPRPDPEATADPNTPLRMHIALKLLRAWGIGDAFHGGVVSTIRQWIDDGMQGPIPWPGGPIFELWAAENGYANVDGSVGFKLKMQTVCSGCQDRPCLRGFLVCQNCWDERTRAEAYEPGMGEIAGW